MQESAAKLGCSPFFQLLSASLAFQDALALWYGPMCQEHVCVCGKNLTVKHAFTCPTGGMPMLRYNKIKDLTADLMSEVCHNAMYNKRLVSMLAAKRISHIANC